MENAAKALLIAGGILIAIMTLSVIVYATTSATRIAQAQDEKKAAEQLAKFNSKFEAYHKDRLYGIDVITVINKAIEHNTKMQAADIADPYYINIRFETIENIKNEINAYDYNVVTKEKSNDRWLSNGDYYPNTWGVVDLNDWEILAGQQYQLGTMGDAGFVFNNSVIEIFDNDHSSPKPLIETENSADPDTITIYTLYSALTNFKRAIFRCIVDPTNPEDYNNGRIRRMTFIQVDTNANLY